MPAQHCSDGSNAAAMAAYRFIETAFLFPITPSTIMAELVEMWSSMKKKNIFGDVPTVEVPQSEAGAAGAIHGSLVSGSLTTTFTASQGLMLMVPNIYIWAGSNLPAVIHVSSRSLATHSSSLPPDHADVYACKDTGIAQLSSGNCQEAYDMATIAHLSAIKSQRAFMHFFEGFRVSHQFEDFEDVDSESLLPLIDFESLDKWRKNSAVDPEKPDGIGPATNREVFWQISEGQNPRVNSIPDNVNWVMQKYGEITGRKYKPFIYIGHPEATHIIVIMGCGSHTAEKVIKILADKGHKVGMIRVHLFRPFSFEYLSKEIPESVTDICVLDRCKTTGSVGEALYEDVLCAMNKAGRLQGMFTTMDQEKAQKGKIRKIIGGRYGICGTEFYPEHVVAALLQLGWRSGISEIDDCEPATEYRGKSGEFIVGIIDDVNGLTPPIPSTKDVNKLLAPNPELFKDEQLNPLMEYILYGLGSDGTIGACRNAMSIVSTLTKCHQQAYFEFDGKKSGGLTLSYMRFRLKNGPDQKDEKFNIYAGKINDQYQIKTAKFIACHTDSYIQKYPNMLDSLIDDGTGVFFLNTKLEWENTPDGLKLLEKELGPIFMKKLAEKRAKLVVADAYKIAEQVGLPGRINSITILFFFRYALGSLVSFEDAIKEMKNSVAITYKKKGQKVIDMNINAIDIGSKMVDTCEVKYPLEKWLNPGNEVCCEDPYLEKYKSCSELTKNIFVKADRREFEEIPVSAVEGLHSVVYPSGLSKFDKPNTAVKLPIWNEKNCIQCNVCSVVCPHQTIRPFLVTDYEVKNNLLPEGFEVVPLKGAKPTIPEKLPDCIPKLEGDLKYRIQISPMDCKGCGLCVSECLANKMSNGDSSKQALTLCNTSMQLVENENNKWKYATETLPAYGHAIFTSGEQKDLTNLRNAQFTHPYMEFNGACPGCQETQYMKMVTQAVDDIGSRLIVSCGVGCCLIWSHYGYWRPFIGLDDSLHECPSDQSKSIRGPAACGSLFEDNAEFGWGVTVGSEFRRNSLLERVKDVLSNENEVSKLPDGLKSMLVEWKDNFRDNSKTRKLERQIKDLLSKVDMSKFKLQTDFIPTLLRYSNFIPSRSYWIYAGDGWAYDIGFGGLDHVLHSNKPTKIMVFDNNQYANTGGQISKATPLGAMGKHAYGGVHVAQKRLAFMMMQAYKHVYVAQISIGYDRNHAYKCIREAEAYNGPALIVGYCPCIAHGITAKGGLACGVGMEEQRIAVETGLWPLFSRNPDKGGKIDIRFAEIKRDIDDLCSREQRWNFLKDRIPEEESAMVEDLRKDIRAHIAQLRVAGQLAPLEESE